MTARLLRTHARWLGQFTAAFSVVLIAYVKGKYVFTFGNTAGSLILLATVTTLLTFIFGIASLPKWQGYVAIALGSFVGYYLLFVPLYALGCN